LTEKKGTRAGLEIEREDPDQDLIEKEDPDQDLIEKKDQEIKKNINDNIYFSYLICLIKEL